MAKITFKRSGGFVGPGMRFELNLNNLPISAVRNITRLVEEAQFFDLPENLIKNFKPDEYQYTITVDAGITNHTVRTNDSICCWRARQRPSKACITSPVCGSSTPAHSIV